MSKYIYGKYDTDTFPDELKNEFHYLCMYLGAYLKYCKEHENYKTFDDYAKAYNLTEKTDDKFRWCYINEAQAFIRDKLNMLSTGKKKYVSKRQIRKLGYSGVLKIPMFPKAGFEIEDKLFYYVFTEKKLVSVKKFFMDYISQKWKTDDEMIGYYFDPLDEEKCVRKTAIYFCGFQEHVLQKEPEIRTTFQGHNTYKTIQLELERRK